MARNKKAVPSPNPPLSAAAAGGFLSLAPPVLHEVALRSVPDEPIKPTSTWVAILFHTIQIPEDLDGEDIFLWIKCHGGITIETIQQYYFTRQPLDEFNLKYINYYPSAAQQVSTLRAQSPWVDNVVVLRAIGLNDVDEVDQEDEDEKMARTTRGEDTYGYFPVGGKSTAINLSDDEDDNDNDHHRTSEAGKDIKDIDQDGDEDMDDDEEENEDANEGEDEGEDHTEQGSSTSHHSGYEDDAGTCRSDSATDQDSEEEYQPNGVPAPHPLEGARIQEHVKGFHAHRPVFYGAPPDPHQAPPDILKCQMESCSRNFVVKPWTVLAQSGPICSACSHAAWMVWAASPVGRPDMKIQDIMQMPGSIEKQWKYDHDLKVSRSKEHFQDWNTDAPIDSAQAAVLGHHLNTSEEGVQLQWPNLSNLEPKHPAAGSPELEEGVFEQFIDMD